MIDTEAPRDSDAVKLQAVLAASLDALLFLEAVRDASGAVVDFVYTEMNERGARLLGLSREEAIGQRLRAFHAGPWVAGYVPLLAEVVRTGAPFEIERKVTDRRMRAGWLRVRFARSDDGVLVVARDIVEHKRARQELELHSAVVRNMTEGVCVVRIADAVILYANPRFTQIFGYEPGELDGTHVSVINAPGWDPEPVFEALHARGEADYEVENVKKDGTLITCHATAARIEHPEHGPVWVVVQADITAEKRASAERLAAEEATRRSLREKEVLLQEVHHRVKNNLQVISSLLRLQAGRVESPQAREVFVESQNRVRSIALLHESLYQSKDLAHIDLSGYLRGLVRSIHRMYGPLGDRVDVVIHGQGVQLELDAAVPCGLIVNELVTNAFKHAFPPTRAARGRVVIEASRSGDRVQVVVSDDGVGLPEGFDLARARTLGMHLIRMLSRQLGGAVCLSGDGGTRCTLTFDDVQPQKELVQA